MTTKDFPTIEKAHFPSEINRFSESDDSKISSDLEMYSKAVEDKLRSLFLKLRKELSTLSLTRIQKDGRTLNGACLKDRTEANNKSTLDAAVEVIVKPIEAKLMEKNISGILPQCYKIQQVEDLINRIVSLKNREPSDEKKSDNQPKNEQLSNNTRGRYKLPKKSRKILKNWFISHLDDPYPSYEEKEELAKEASITIKQVTSWFINTRGRAQKPKEKDFDFTDQIQKKLRRDSKPI